MGKIQAFNSTQLEQQNYKLVFQFSLLHSIQIQLNVGNTNFFLKFTCIFTVYRKSQGRNLSALAFPSLSWILKEETEKRSRIIQLFSPPWGWKCQTLSQTSASGANAAADRRNRFHPLCRPAESKKRDPGFSSGFCRYVLTAEENCIRGEKNPENNTYLPVWELKFFQVCQQQAHPATCVLTPLPQVWVLWPAAS